MHHKSTGEGRRVIDCLNSAVVCANHVCADPISLNGNYSPLKDQTLSLFGSLSLLRTHNCEYILKCNSVKDILKFIAFVSLN